MRITVDIIAEKKDCLQGFGFSSDESVNPLWVRYCAKDELPENQKPLELLNCVYRGKIKWYHLLKNYCFNDKEHILEILIYCKAEYGCTKLK